MDIHDTVIAPKRAAGKADVISGILWCAREVGETAGSGSDQSGGELMKVHVAMLATAMALACAVDAYGDIVNINAISASGLGKVIGTIGISDASEGLVIMPDLTELPPGDHGFHIHVNPDCGPGAGADGQPAAGLAAGGHFDPATTGKHLGPHGQGHKGDLPAMRVDSGGNAMTAVIAPNLKLADVKGRAIMIHAGGDNYSDQPAPLGGGGARIACGVIK
jgi:Cu-Zn family superoxide dismutase